MSKPDRSGPPKTFTNWSWPIHPRGMTSADARMRVPRRGVSVGPGPPRPFNADRLGREYGALFADGRAGCQQRFSHGDRLPRDHVGWAFSLRQQVAVDVWEGAGRPTGGVYLSEPDQPSGLSRNTSPDYQAAVRLSVPAAPIPFHAVDLERVDDVPLADHPALGSVVDAIEGCERSPDPRETAAVFRAAIDRGRDVAGATSDLRLVALRCATAIEQATRDKPAIPAVSTSSYRLDSTPGGGVRVTAVAAVPPGASGPAAAAAHLYGTVLGGLAAVYGPARSPASVALDSLSANLIVQRGVSGAGLGG